MWDPWRSTGGRALQALDGFVVADCTRFAVAQHRVHLVELQLLQVERTEEIRGKSTQLCRRFDQPVQDGVGSDLEDPSRGADPQALSQAGQDMYDAFHLGVFAVEEPWKVALARGAVQLPPGAAIRMAIGAEIAQPEPAAIVTIGVGTKVHRGIHRPGASGRWRHGIGPWRALEASRGSLAHTEHRRLVRQPLERFRLGRTLTLGRDGRGWHGRRGRASPGPAERQHDEEPEESQQSELVVKQV